MAGPCSGCQQKKGAQKLVELTRIGNYAGITVEKIHHSQIVHHPLKLNLDRFHTRSFYGGSSIVMDLIGFIGEIRKRENEEMKGSELN